MTEKFSGVFWHGSPVRSQAAGLSQGLIRPGLYLTSWRQEAEDYAGIDEWLDPDDQGEVVSLLVGLDHPFFADHAPTPEQEQQAIKDGHDGWVCAWAPDFRDPSDPRPGHLWVKVFDAEKVKPVSEYEQPVLLLTVRVVAGTQLEPSDFSDAMTTIALRILQDNWAYDLSSHISPSGEDDPDLLAVTLYGFNSIQLDQLQGHADRLIGEIMEALPIIAVLRVEC